MGPARTAHTNAHSHHSGVCRSMCAAGIFAHNLTNIEITKYWNKYYRLWILYVVLTRRYRSVPIFGALFHVYTLLKKYICFFFHLHILLLSLLSACSPNKRTSAQILEFVWRPNIVIHSTAVEYMKFASMFLCLSLKCEFISVPRFSITLSISKYARNILQFMYFMTIDVRLPESRCVFDWIRIYVFPEFRIPFCHKHKHW